MLDQGANDTYDANSQRRLIQLIARDVAIDLGTANTLIYERGSGLVLNEPSVVAIRRVGERVLPIAYGAEAKMMLGRTPTDLEVIRPIRTGIIADFQVTGLMLDHFIKKAVGGRYSLTKPRVVVGVPSGITEVERRAIREIVDIRAREVYLLDEAMAAAIGCGLPVNEAVASMVVDIGGGTTDIAIVSLGDVVQAISIRQGGDTMDEAIINYLRRVHHLLIGDATAELVKKTLGSADPQFDQQQLEVRGRSLTKSGPAAVRLTSREVRGALADVVAAITAAVRQTLEATPPELSGDIVARGIVLAGGGAFLKGLDQRLSNQLGISVCIAQDAAAAVAIGCGRVLDNLKGYRDLLV